MFTNIKLSPSNSLVINVDYDKGLIFISPDLKEFSTLGQVSVKETIGACKLARKWREGRLYWDNVKVPHPNIRTKMNNVHNQRVTQEA